MAATEKWVYGKAVETISFFDIVENDVFGRQSFLRRR
jgi:hypothetical protein